MSDEINCILEKLSEIKLHKVFNPYCQINPQTDKIKANSIRLNNLKNYLVKMKKLNPKIIWIGEALGYKGGKRTGIPFSDDYLIENLSKDNFFKFERATKDTKQKETAATIVWNEINKLKELPFLWNIFPLHPFQIDDLTNRKPKKSEISQVFNISELLFLTFDFDLILAIGKSSFDFLKSKNINSIYIRHPSHGGKLKFIYDVDQFYKNNY